jgi:hypothetical protein
MTTTLPRITEGDGDYVAKFDTWADLLEAVLSQLEGQITGQSGGLAVPYGLQEIFDRRGLIGIDSYDFEEGVLTGPAYNLLVDPGGYWDGAGIFYRKATSSSLSLAGKATGTYYLNLDAAGNPVVDATSDLSTSRQFSWNASTHTVAAKAVYAGVEILLDGDDYAACLASVARAKIFTTMAARLEEIEELLAKTVQTPAAADTINLNWSLGGHARVTLDRATTTFNFSGAYDGQKCVLELLQDAVGGRAVAFGASAAAGTDFTFPVPLSGADKTDFLGFIYVAGNGKYNYVSLARGY